MNEALCSWAQKFPELNRSMDFLPSMFSVYWRASSTSQCKSPSSYLAVYAVGEINF